MNNKIICSTSWLNDNLGDVKILDSSFYLPAENRNADSEFASLHIPGAQRFNIDVVCSSDTDLPHMFPDPITFADAVGDMGISNADTVITYDGGKMTGACRVWWMFRAFGHNNVAVLDGGFSKWKKEGREVEHTITNPPYTKFCSDYQDQMVRSVRNMLELVNRGGETQILDARGVGRFDGTEAEPRAGVRSGHMPGAINLPYDKLLNEDGTLRSSTHLRDLFEDAGVDLKQPVVTTCGSGVSAALLLLGLVTVGHEANMLYDGSWSEWGGRDDTPIVA